MTRAPPIAAWRRNPDPHRPRPAGHRPAHPGISERRSLSPPVMASMCR